MRRSVVLAGVAVLSGCAVGPDFKPPSAPEGAGYGALPGEMGKEPMQQLRMGEEVPGRWWTLFRSQALDTLVEEALRNSPTVQSAQAALRQARELAAAQRESLFPGLQAVYGLSRQQNAVGTLSPTLSSGEDIFNLHTAQVNVAYALDLFGANRRQTESLVAQADYQQWQQEAASLTLAGSVVLAAIQEASLRAQLAATEDILRSEREAARILRHQYELGSIAELDVMAQEATLAATEATVPGLTRQLAQQRHLLAALAGRLPDQEPPQHFELGELTLPEDVPVSLPSALVRQRPDVLAAQAQLHAATAEVGVADAQLLPQLTLTANAGGASTVFNQLTAPGNTFWLLGGSLSQTLFQGGALRHRQRAAEAALDQAGAQYRAVVLAAFQNVADCLTALQQDAAAVNASQRARDAAAAELAVTRRNVELGSTSYLALLNAEQTYGQALLSLAQARASRYADTAALLVALGGGWWNRPGR